MVGDERDLVEGDVWRIEKHGYRCICVPASLPPWVQWLSGRGGDLDGIVSAVVIEVMLRRHRRPPWVVLVYRVRWFRRRLVCRIELDDRSEANRVARRLDSELARGRLPPEIDLGLTRSRTSE